MNRRNLLDRLRPLLMVGIALTIVTALVIALPSREEAPVEMRETVPAEREAEPTTRDPGAMITPEQLSRTFREVAQEVLPVVVEVNVVEVVRQTAPRSLSPWEYFFGPQAPGGPEPQQREFERPGLGSGVIIARQGENAYVVTNNHVVGQASRISVTLYDRREYEAEVVGRDPRTDLAVISFRPDGEVPIALLGDSGSAEVGDWVLAVGNPYGFEATVTSGIVSAVRREAGGRGQIGTFSDYIQTDAAINPGNSGGALVNLTGEVIGINTWIASQTGGSVGLGFAIPVNTVRRVVTDVLERGRVSYGWLGVTIVDPEAGRFPELATDLGIEGRRGALVLNISRGSPADQSGVLPGDLIVRMDDTPIDSSNQLTRRIGLLSPGETTTLVLVRDAAEQTLTVRIDERAPEEDLADGSLVWPGLAVVPLGDQLLESLNLDQSVRGVVVADVVGGSASDASGLRPGDVVLRVNDRPADTVRAFYRELNATRGDEVRLRILRQGREIGVGLVK
ncbi:MAG: Do family serine endopeptidase [Spirochaetaceae bacterium]|nr:MAG: Do family serine endopeptidase [Spirochaetaceae bacterium]